MEEGIRGKPPESKQGFGFDIKGGGCLGKKEYQKHQEPYRFGGMEAIL